MEKGWKSNIVLLVTTMRLLGKCDDPSHCRDLSKYTFGFWIQYESISPFEIAVPQLKLRMFGMGKRGYADRDSW